MILRDFTDLALISSLPPQLTVESDPLLTAGVLEEAYPVMVYVDSVHSRASVVLDCRFCDGVPGNSAILTVGVLSELRWARSHEPALAALTIVTWNPSTVHGWSVRAGLGWTGADELSLRGDSAFFVCGDIEGFDGAPPNFATDDEETVAAGLPRLESSFAPRGCSSYRWAREPFSAS